MVESKLCNAQCRYVLHSHYHAAASHQLPENWETGLDGLFDVVLLVIALMMRSTLVLRSVLILVGMSSRSMDLVCVVIGNQMRRHFTRASLEVDIYATLQRLVSCKVDES